MSSNSSGGYKQPTLDETPFISEDMKKKLREIPEVAEADQRARLSRGDPAAMQELEKKERERIKKEQGEEALAEMRRSSSLGRRGTVLTKNSPRSGVSILGSGVS